MGGIELIHSVEQCLLHGAKLPFEVEPRNGSIRPFATSGLGTLHVGAEGAWCEHPSVESIAEVKPLQRSLPTSSNSAANGARNRIAWCTAQPQLGNRAQYRWHRPGALRIRLRRQLSPKRMRLMYAPLNYSR
jgi:hypothetical protein